LNEVQVEVLRQFIMPTMGQFDEPALTQRWVQGLAFATAMHPDFSSL